MKKFIIAGMAVAMLAISRRRFGRRAALRGVGPRQHHGHDREVHGHPARKSRSQWSNVWKHDFTVIVHPDGSFTGTGDVTNGVTGSVVWTENHRHVQC